MTRDIPIWPLILGLLGTLPFIFGAFASLFPELIGTLTQSSLFVARLLGGIILITYGTVILAFMSGVLWGFASGAPDESARKYYMLSVITAILLFFYASYAFIAPLVGAGQPSLLPLLVGFILLLGLDYVFWSSKLTPEWWMKLRALITSIVTVCLGIGVAAG